MVIGSAAVILVALIYVFWPSEPEFPETVEYSAYPPDWIEEEDTHKKINVPEATEGRGEFIGDQQRYVDVDGEILSLFYGGSYEGNIIKNSYRDEEGNTLMRIWDQINPHDGVIEGYGLFKREDDKFVIYLFVDEDWKQESRGNINIIWGNNISEKDSLHHRRFDFSNVKDGVYIDRVEKDVSWFYTQNPVFGRLFFGEITLEDIKKKDYEKTFIALT